MRKGPIRKFTGKKIRQERGLEIVNPGWLTWLNLINRRERSSFLCWDRGVAAV
jgi:hypothetical protein